MLINSPKKVERERKGTNPFVEDKFSQMKIGDECVFGLTNKGEILSFGENIDGQLGC